MPTESKRTCPSCGKPVQPDLSVCDNCGEDLTVQPVEEMIVAAPPPPPPAPAPKTSTASSGSSRAQSKGQQKGPQKKKEAVTVTFTMGQLVLAVVVLLVGVFIVIKLTTDRGSSNAQTAADGAAPSVDLAALDQFRTAAEATPANPEAIVLYANKLHDSKLIDQAIVQYKRYLALVSDDANAGIDLGTCYFELKEYDEAARQMEAVLAKHPDHQRGCFNLGIVKYNAGELASAQTWFRKAIEIDPKSTDAENARRVLDEISKNPMK